MWPYGITFTSRVNFRRHIGRYLKLYYVRRITEELRDPLQSYCVALRVYANACTRGERTRLLFIIFISLRLSRCEWECMYECSLCALRAGYIYANRRSVWFSMETRSRSFFFATFYYSRDSENRLLFTF